MAEMVSRKVDVMVQAGVPLTVTQDWDYHTQLAAQVAKLTKIPFATDIGACIEAMQFLGMRRVAMITPFDDAMHEKLIRYVSQAGIQVLAAHSIRLPDADDIARHYDVSTVPLSVPYHAAKTLFWATAGADGIWITWAVMFSLAAIQPLEQDLEVPVVTSMQAMAWAGFRLAGVKAEVSGYGCAFLVSLTPRAFAVLGRKLTASAVTSSTQGLRIYDRGTGISLGLIRQLLENLVRRLRTFLARA